MFWCNEAILYSNRDNKYFKYGHNGQILIIHIHVVMITKHIIELQNIYTIVALMIKSHTCTPRGNALATTFSQIPSQVIHKSSYIHVELLQHIYIVTWHNVIEFMVPRPNSVPRNFPNVDNNAIVHPHLLTSPLHCQYYIIIFHAAFQYTCTPVGTF